MPSSPRLDVMGGIGYGAEADARAAILFGEEDEAAAFSDDDDDDHDDEESRSPMSCRCLVASTAGMDRAAGVGDHGRRESDMGRARGDRRERKRRAKKF